MPAQNGAALIRGLGKDDLRAAILAQTRACCALHAFVQPAILSLANVQGAAGLVLTGGGARGAYQAGALLALAEISRAGRLPFSVLAGSSAGSINAAFLAARADDFGQATRDLADLWTTLEPQRVFRTDLPALAKTAGDWLIDLGLGGFIGTGRGKSLLDTSPLRELIASRLDPSAIGRNVARGLIRGLGVSATSYETGCVVTFFEGADDIAPWTRISRAAIRSKLQAPHILASSAIPFFFPAVEIDGAWYGDGSVRLGTPLSPAIRMGAARIVAIGVRPLSPSTADKALKRQGHYPTAAEAAGVLLNAIFVDSLEADVERADRINQTVALIPEALRARHATPLRSISLLVLRPSIDPQSLVLRTLDRFPAALKHLFRGLGSSEDSGWELLSYLGFDGVYTTRLFELGYEDTLARSDEVVAFLDAS
jgi:NTE family protein